MSKLQIRLTEAQKELIAKLETEDFLENDLFVNGKPLTLERRRKLGWPETLEAAMARMDENKRKQEEAERQSQG